MANIEEARNMSIWAFYNAVKTGGDWDYKQLGPEYEDFGNYNYGVVGSAAGFSEGELERAAGAYQIYQGRSQDDWGWPWGNSPYGDDPKDQRWINEGIKDYGNYYGKWYE